MTLKDIEAPVDDDRAWFEEHPKRNHRLRSTFPFEKRTIGGDYVLIRQVRPGIRLRAILDNFAPKTAEDFDDEMLLQAIFVGLVAQREDLQKTLSILEKANDH